MRREAQSGLSGGFAKGDDKTLAGRKTEDEGSGSAHAMLKVAPIELS